MDIPRGLNWALSPREAADQQRSLSEQVIEKNDFNLIRKVAGVDVGFEDQKRTARAAAVILSFPRLEPLEETVARRQVVFPYIPGLLAFRELPAVLGALSQLSSEPDLIIVDGHGRAHPRRFGIACHLGVILRCPTIGCAKSILVGRADDPANRVGAWTPLIDKGEVIGAALRTRVGVAPIYVSIGHRVDLETAIEYVGKCTAGYRLPQTTRFAHLVASGKRLAI